MPTVNELCRICNAPEDIEHFFINCTSATRVWKHFLLLLNKVLLFTVTKTVDLLPLRIFPVKVDHKSYLLVLYLIKLILYQIWLARWVAWICTYCRPCRISALLYYSTLLLSPPWCRKHGKSMEFKGDHGFPMLPMLPLLFHAMQKHGKAWEAWEYFSGCTSRAWISMEFMGQDILVI